MEGGSNPLALSYGQKLIQGKNRFLEIRTLFVKLGLPKLGALLELFQ